MNADELVEQVQKLFQRDLKILPLARAVEEAGPSWKRFKAIRAFYREVQTELRSAPAHVWAIDPYTVDWTKIFTPIEFGLWIDIRAEGAVLYPQYPVGRYFADFANPAARVVIECDGAKWHTDAEKDSERQQHIEAMGWHVYRITGRGCLEPDEIEHEEDEERFVPNPDRAAFFIRDIARTHLLSARFARARNAD